MGDFIRIGSTVPGREHDDGIVLDCDSAEEIRDAQLALWEYGIASARVYRGEAPDVIETSSVLYAADPRVDVANGLRVVAVGDLSDEDVARALEVIGADVDDAVREAIHSEVYEDGRTWLAAYAVRYVDVHGSVRVLW